MKSAKLLLALAVTLFVAWIGYLAYLVFTVERPAISAPPFRVTKQPAPVVSRPQLLVTDFLVGLDVTDAEGAIKPDSIEVVWKKDSFKDTENLKKLVEAAHLDLSHCKGFAGPGRYLVPIRQAHIDVLEVAHVPPSPGFSPIRSEEIIYPDTPEVRQQLREVPTTEQRQPGQ